VTETRVVAISKQTVVDNILACSNAEGKAKEATRYATRGGTESITVANCTP
jgi:hypothetical protein